MRPSRSRLPAATPPQRLSAYAMTLPGGDVSRLWWEWLSVQPLVSFEVLDGFALPDGSPNAGMPSMQMTLTFEATSAGSRVTTMWRPAR